MDDKRGQEESFWCCVMGSVCRGFAFVIVSLTKLCVCGFSFAVIVESFGEMGTGLLHGCACIKLHSSVTAADSFTKSNTPHYV